MSYIMPENPEDFSLEVISMLTGVRPHLNIELLKPLSILIEGRRLDLSNLYKMVQTDKNNGRTIALEYIVNLFESTDDLKGITTRSFLDVETRIFPRIQHKSFFENLDMHSVVWTPWVNDCVISYVIDFPKMTMSISCDQILEWGITVDDTDFLARKNLHKKSENVELSVSEVDGSIIALLNSEDGYDASRILLDDLYNIMFPTFGGNFYVGIPGRDILVAFPATKESKPLIQNIVDRMKHEFVYMPYPITSNIFYVTLDGVAPGYPNTDL